MAKRATYYESLDKKFKILHLVTLDHKNLPMYHFISIGGRKSGCVTKKWMIKTEDSLQIHRMLHT